MNHQVQNLSSFGLELKSFDVRTHEKTSGDKQGSLTMLGTTWQVGGLKGPCGALYVSNNLSKRAGQLLDLLKKSTNLVGNRQEALDLFEACQRSKSAPKMKNFRPIWTMRICSSSMILRK